MPESIIMGINSYWSKPQQTKETSELEAYLQSTLTPVSPRPDFVKDLRVRLEYNQSEQPSALSMAQMMVAVLAVGVGGTILVFSILRVMVAIIHTVSGLRRRNPDTVE
jgi:hypothetical protein